MESTTKTCCRCNETKAEKEFVFYVKGNYYRTVCKACELARARARVKKTVSKEQTKIYKLNKKAKDAAEKLGFKLLRTVWNGTVMTTCNDYGGFMIINQRNNTVEAGLNYDMTPEQVLQFCSEVVEVRSTQ